MPVSRSGRRTPHGRAELGVYVRVVVGNDHDSKRSGGVPSAGVRVLGLATVVRSGKLRAGKGVAVRSWPWTSLTGLWGCAGRGRGGCRCRFCEVVAERAEVLAEALPYRLGEFYRRELPPIIYSIAKLAVQCGFCTYLPVL